MKIAINIDDELGPSFVSYLALHYPGQPFTVEEFVIFQIQNLVQAVGSEFPPASVTADIAAIKVLEQRVKESLKITKEEPK